MRILAVDFGEARTGLAICDSGEMLSSPAGTIHEKNADVVIDKIIEAAKNYRAEEIVFGLPKNMDGTEGERAVRCRQVSEKLGEKSGIPVVLWDERSSTKTATYYMNETDTRGKKRKNVIDSAAAAIILDSYLAFRKNKRG